MRNDGGKVRRRSGRGLGFWDWIGWGGMALSVFISFVHLLLLLILLVEPVGFRFIILVYW